MNKFSLGDLIRANKSYMGGMNIKCGAVCKVCNIDACGYVRVKISNHVYTWVSRDVILDNFDLVKPASELEKLMLSNTDWED